MDSENAETMDRLPARENAGGAICWSSCCSCRFMQVALSNKAVPCLTNAHKLPSTPRKGGRIHADGSAGGPCRRRGGYPAPNSRNDKHKRTYAKINKHTALHIIV